MTPDKRGKTTATKRDEPLSLYGMTPEQAIAKAFRSPPIKKKQAPKKPAK